VRLKAAVACKRLGLAVPAEVAILGVDNEDILCELSVLPLSSIALDLERIGWEAALALAATMEGRLGSGGPVVVPPREVVERDSTRTVSTGDELTDKALAVMYSSSSRGLTAGHVLLTVHCSRRTLQKRFRLARGRSIHRELILQRVQVARELLRDTTLTVDAIAREAGFANAQRSYAAFRKVQGTTPATYRRSYRR